MKVFISWSGKRSKAVGELLNDWLQCVLQALNPWMSSKDIDRGSLWFSEINDQLKDTGIGIVCITTANLNKPWILFEAGALAKGLSSNRVCTFLVDLKSTDISDPLAQFNHTLPNKEGLWALVRTLNNSLNDKKLAEKILENVFETYWPQFEKSFDEIIARTKDDIIVVKREEEDILSELLYTTRTLDKRLRSIEYNSERSFKGNDSHEIDWRVMNRSELLSLERRILKELNRCDNSEEGINRVISKYKNHLPMDQLTTIVNKYSLGNLRTEELKVGDII